MGGAITPAVNEVREKGIIVISLNMVGSVTDAADLVVTDPVQGAIANARRLLHPAAA